jgi:ribosomal protein L7/L12
MNNQQLVDSNLSECINDDLDDNHVLAITDVGSSFPKVFVAVKEITGKSTKEAKEIMDSRMPIVILRGTKMELIQKSIRLEEAGAKVEFFLTDR